MRLSVACIGSLVALATGDLISAELMCVSHARQYTYQLEGTSMIPSISNYIKQYAKDGRINMEDALDALGMSREGAVTRPITSTLELAVDAMVEAHYQIGDLASQVGGYPQDGDKSMHVTALVGRASGTAKLYWKEHGQNLAGDEGFTSVIVEQYLRDYIMKLLERRMRKELRSSSRIACKVVEIGLKEFDLAQPIANHIIPQVADRLPLKPIESIADEDIEKAIQSLLKT